MLEVNTINNNQDINIVSVMDYEVNNNKIHVMLDDVSFNHKPNFNDVRDINNRMIRNPKKLTIEELANEIVKGKTFIPALFKPDSNGYIRRQKEYWKSQQIVCLDFDNEITVMIDGKKVKQKHVTMNIEDCMFDEFFQNHAAFLYTSFRHSQDHHKLRVVFVLDEVIRDYQKLEWLYQELLKRYPNADQSCKDGTRLFYGGKEVYQIDYTNKLSIHDIGRYDSNEGFCVAYNLSNVLVEHYKQQQTPTTSNLTLTTNNEVISKSINQPYITNNIEMIRNKDIEGLRNVVNSKPIQLDSMLKVGNYLKQQDMRVLLGVADGTFHDIFHDEVNPSASIYVSKSNHYLYKCFSEGYNFTGTVIDVIMKIHNCDMVQARNFLMEVYQVTNVIGQKKQYLKELLDEYKYLFINDDLLKEVYPNIHKVLGRYTKDIYIVLDLAKEFINPSGGDLRMMFYHTTFQLAEMFMSSPRTAVNRMNLFTLVDIVKKLNDKEIPTQFKNSLRVNQVSSQYKYRNDVYEVTEYPKDFMEQLEEQCKYLFNTGFTLRGMTFEGLYRNYGEQTARKVFTQEDKDKKFSELSQEVINKIHTIILEIINEVGWVTEKICLEKCKLYFKGQEQYKKDKMKETLNHLIDGYDLERIRLNKNTKKQMGIDDEELSGYPFLIRRKQWQKNNLIESANLDKAKQ